MKKVPEILQSTDTPILISFDLCPFVQRSTIVLAAKRQVFVRINIDLNNKPDWFLQISPTGKVPVLVVNSERHGTVESQTIFESSIINEYLDEEYGPQLHPTDLLKKAHHRSWISFSESLLMLQYQAICAKKLVDASQLIDKLFNECLKLKVGKKGYFEGDQFSLVDAAFAPFFSRLRAMPLLLQKLEEHAQNNPSTKNLLRWINHVGNLDIVVNSLPTNFYQLYEQRFLQMDSALITAQLQFA